MDLSYWALGSAVVLLVLYKLGTWNHNYFTSRGIKSTKTMPFLGSLSPIVFRTRAFADLCDDICKEFKDERIVGMFQFLSPVLVIKDPELIKRITVKDFDHFTDHQHTSTEEIDPLLAKNLFSLKGERWRDMRATLSPAFTSSKMKNMFHFMNQCGQQLGDYLQDEINKLEAGKPYTLDMKDLFRRFTNDVIATSAFGIHIDSFREKDNHFYQMGKRVTDFTGRRSFVLLGHMISPKLMEFLGIQFFTKEESSFFFDMVHDTITTRDKHGIVRPDMIHLLMQARKGELKAERGEEEEFIKAKNIDLTEGDIASQAMIFFAAGFDTASTLMSFASILLATHEDIQRRLQQEIEDILGDDKQVTYDKVQQMKYLDMVLSESLRLYPPGIMSNRQCTKNFIIPASENQPEFTVREGDVVMIPTFGIHRDPKYFPDPEKFDPERFSDENKHNIDPYTYLPFGVGPRLCIGQRFALLEVKVAFVHILTRFSLVVVEKTPLPIRLDSKGFVMAVDGGCWLGVTPRQQLTT